MSNDSLGIRFYPHPKFGQVPSVTSIESLTLVKKALTPWAAKVASDHFLAHCQAKSYPSTIGFGDEVTVCDLKDIEEGHGKAKNAWRAKSKQATGIGTEVHEALEQYLTNGSWPWFAHDESKLAVHQFPAFVAEHDIVPIELEPTVLHPDYPYAGRADLICMMHGKKYLVDFKTSARFYLPDFPIQVSAYAKALGIQNIAVIRLDKETGAIQMQDYSIDLDFYWNWFLVLLEAAWKAIKFDALNKTRNYEVKCGTEKVSTGTTDHCKGADNRPSRKRKNVTGRNSKAAKGKKDCDHGGGTGSDCTV